MTRKDRLYAMRMVELVEVAEAEGIKIDRKGSKAKAVEKILAAEAAREEVVAEETEALAESFQNEVEEAVPETAEVIEEPKAEKKVRKPREKKENPARIEFRNRALKALEAAGFTAMTWEKIPNLFTVKNGKKSLGDVRMGLKGWTLNAKVEVAECMGMPYHLQRNYYAPATLKFGYDNFGAFEDYLNNL